MAVVVAIVAMDAGSAVAATSVPAARRYELVSPRVKNGGNVMPMPTRTRAATDGSAIQFASLAAFGDIAGTGIAAEYISRRDGKPGTNGWSVHGIFPKLDPLSLNGAGGLNLDTSYQAELSDNLSTGIFRTFTNLSGDPLVQQVPNLYLRNDLLSPGAGSYDLLTACAICAGVPLTLEFANSQSWVADTTSDFGHIIFESRYNLATGASTSQPKLYEWDHGTVFLAGILPASQGGGPAVRSIAGAGASVPRYTLHTISDDGSKIFFTVPTFANDNKGDLYMRVNHTTTSQLNASERTDCADDPGSCTGALSPDPNGPQPATFGTASTDGSKVFFVSNEQLTDTPGFGLYEYDTTLPDTDPHNLTLLSPDADSFAGPSVVNVIGASDDASYVYFTANDQLVSGEPETDGTDGIYLWHANTVKYLGALADPDDVGNDAVSSDAVNWVGGRLASRVTPDGTHLLFTSHSGDRLTGYAHGTTCQSPTGACAELYLYNATTDTLTCASCNPSGATATSNAGFDLSEAAGGARATSHLNHALSSDGRYVFFTSGERLVPEDRNGAVRDAYAYDSTTGTLHLLSSGRSPDNSYFLDASADGRDAFFATRERLVGWDTDNDYDLYDARIGGGFPEPPAPVAECKLDACQGALGSPPSPLGTLATGTPHAVGNVTHAHRKKKQCARGKVRKRVHGKVKCVKKKKHKAHRRAAIKRAR